MKIISIYSGRSWWRPVCLSRLLVVLAAGSLAHAQLPSIPTPVPNAPEGAIWEFPSTFTPVAAPYSGLYKPIYNPNHHPWIRHKLVALTWDALNPYENQYNFAVVQALLDTAANPGGGLLPYMILFRLKASVFSGPEEGFDPDNPTVKYNATRTIPAWVTAKYGITAASGTFETKAGKRYAAPWHPGVQREFAKFILELNRQKLIQSPHCIGFYLHGVSTSYGEEMSVHGQTSTQVNEMLATVPSGSTIEDTIVNCWVQRMDLWSLAAGAYTYKVAWVNSGSWSSAEYDRIFMDTYALEPSGANLALRHGHLENYFINNVHPNDASLPVRVHYGEGQEYFRYTVSGSTPTHGYVRSDWNHPLRDGRYFADEIEVVYDETEAIPFSERQKWSFRSSFFRAAQMGLNFIWTSRDIADFETLDPNARLAAPILGWWTKVAGKPAAESPDAICWLREARVRLIDGTQTGLPWTNMERLLSQRDVYEDAANGPGTPIPGAMTVKAELTDLPNVDSKADWPPYGADEFLARRTDNANGQTMIAFKLEPAFMESLREEAEDVEFRVTYRDVGQAHWTVRIPRGGGAYTNLGQVVNTDSGLWKTAIFTLPGEYFAAYNMFAPNTDTGPEVNFVLRLNANTPAGDDLIVRFARVVRTAEVAKSPSIRAQPESRVALSGGTVRLSVDARGPGALTYQWKRNGTNISGATNAQHVIAGLDGTKTGNYTVTVSNGVSAPVTSATAAVALADVQVKDAFASGTSSWGSTGATLSNSSGTLKIAFGSGTAAKIASKTYSPLVTGTFWDHPRALRFKVRRDSATSDANLQDGQLFLQVRENDPAGERFNFAIGRFARGTTFTTVTVPLHNSFLDADANNPGATFQLTTNLHVRFVKQGLADAFTIYVDDIEVIELQDINPAAGI